MYICQRRFTKRFLRCGLQYSERFAKLEVDSLELRLRLDLIYMYKLLHGIVDTDVPALFVTTNIDTVTQA